MSENVPEKFIDLVEALGADESTSYQKLTLYIPNKDRHGIEFDQRPWVEEAAQILTKIGGGATIMPPTEGWWDDGQGSIVKENPVVVYTFINEQEFYDNLPNLREFAHRMGRKTDQGEIVIEFEGDFLRIRNYDSV